LKKLSEDVLVVLSNCHIEGRWLFLHSGQLERKLYLSVNEALEALGGKWNRKIKGHVFEDDPTIIFENMMVTGEVVSEKKEFGQFFTPLPIVNEFILPIVMERLHPFCRILEPSAGSGNLIQEILKIVPAGNITCVEQSSVFCNKLTELGVAVYNEDFLKVPVEPIFDLVIMNPPFRAPGIAQADISHIRHAFDFLKEGGLLVSIMSAGVLFRENAATVNFRNFISRTICTFEKLPDDAFKESGTLVKTVRLTIQKS
jgi:predicted RNA methylase